MTDNDKSWINFYEKQIKLHESIADEDYDDYVIDGLPKQEFLQLCRQEIIMIKLSSKTEEGII